ncbi:HK97 gp10 family phage protein [Thomasclavelia spiroformis]|uniref:HK97 gp10 family phage protein n=1 Tax=Thomasclavelia spiroformis TaxID=29348 RepID=UPI0039914814
MCNVKFEDNTVKVTEALEGAINKFLEEAAGELEAQTKRNTRVNSTKTKESWTHVVNKDKKEAIVGNPMENAIWEEFGTGEYAVNGDGRKGA